MADPVFIEVAITWAAAAGCLFYLLSMHRSQERGDRALLLLMAVLAGLLAIRGFGWLGHDPRYLRPTFAFATLLPLAITLFVERVLRRHHPLWVKLLGLGASAVFFIGNLVINFTAHRELIAVFGICLAFTVFVNAGMLLMRRRAGLSHAETHLANLLLLVALLSVPLVLSDFRRLPAFHGPKLGALAALLLVYALVGSAVRTMGIGMWLLRLIALNALALILSALVALALAGSGFAAWSAAVLQVLPLAVAWLLLTGIVVNRVVIASGGNSQKFLRWLANAPLDSGRHLLASLGGSPDASSYLVLEATDLANYRVDVLARLADANDRVASLGLARARRAAETLELAESAEQWVDLFERLQMTHAFLARRDPPCVVLVSLPASTSAAAAEDRLRVVQHLASHLGGG